MGSIIPLCPTGNNELKVPKGFMSWKTFEKLASELSSYLIEASFIGYGEPMLHPRIYDMVEYLSSRNVKTGISTNGQNITDEKVAVKIVKSKLSTITIAVDGASEETYQKYRQGGSFETVIKGIRMIQKIKREEEANTPRIKLQFIVMKHNEHEIEAIRAIAKELNVKLKLKTVSVSNSTKEFLPENSEFSRYSLDKKNKLNSKQKQSKACDYAWLWAVINWDGTVVPCCKDPHRVNILGVIDDDRNYTSVWRSKEYASLRLNLLKNREQLKLCKKCVVSIPIPE
ncbi:MAG: radical SAM protein [Bacteroidetes bacterium]|nr:radical SAM protein [Bacteroidota bacterium]